MFGASIDNTLMQLARFSGTRRRLSLLHMRDIVLKLHSAVAVPREQHTKLNLATL